MSGNPQMNQSGEWFCRQGLVCKFERVHRAAIAVAGAHDVGSALQIIVDSAREVAGAELAALGVPDASGEQLAHFVISGLPGDQAAHVGEPPRGEGVLGVLLREGKPVRTPDIEKHPAFKGYPPHHPPIRSFLGVPVQSGGEVIGDLYLANKIEGDTFTQEDQSLIEMLAAHAAVVIQSLRYHRQAQELALLQERERLARQLQDDVLQAMYGAGLLLGTLDLHDPDRAAGQVAEIQARLDDAILRLREHLLGLTDSGNGSHR
ncbi:MAG TPA: GAF domain-containing protein [Chloroflexi bacterium]|nr:GAF domain-containing protein [Chloroflexota bacterium]